MGGSAPRPRGDAAPGGARLRRGVRRRPRRPASARLMVGIARRYPLVSFAVCTASFVVLASGASVGASRPAVRDVGVAAGLRPSVGDGYSIHPHDVNHDGWPDLLLGRHGGAAELFVNEPAGGVSACFSLSYRVIRS